MIIKSIMTDEDRKALEYMLSLEYAMPYQLLKTKNNRRKIIYIMTPVLFLLSIGCYFVKSYPMFYVEMGISIIALIWIIWFQSKGKKFENNVHEKRWFLIRSDVDNATLYLFHVSAKAGSKRKRRNGDLFYKVNQRISIILIIVFFQHF